VWKLTSHYSLFSGLGLVSVFSEELLTAGAGGGDDIARLAGGTGFVFTGHAPETVTEPGQD